ncbi:hypothetical protein [Aeromonas caviae]|uniref:hypothetical protein n=1 Tax=Aeromonas caviae TaxID=648 RepID=UPI002B471E31|nr:hypothetical protein [Aeromonas caviae]
MSFEYEEILEQQKIWLGEGFNPKITMRKGDDVTLQDKYYGTLLCAALLSLLEMAHHDADSLSSGPLTKFGTAITTGLFTRYENDSLQLALNGVSCDDKFGTNFTFAFDRNKLTKRGLDLINQWSTRSTGVKVYVNFPDEPAEAWIHIEPC